MSEQENKRLKEELEDLRVELGQYKEAEEKRHKRKIWAAKKLGSWWTSFFLGKEFKDNIKKLVAEFREKRTITNDTIGDVIASGAWRFTRVSLLMLFMAFLPTLMLIIQTNLLYKQNDKIDVQNQLIQSQNKRLDQQTYLQEADRRSSLVFMFSNIMDAIDRELKEDYTSDGIRNISPQLIGRIVALSKRLKPYRYLEGDSLIEKPLSPERGQLLVSLVESKLDTATYHAIFEKGNFAYADLYKSNLYKAYLEGINLSQANLVEAKLNLVNLRGAVLLESDLSSAQLASADLTGVLMKGVSLRNAKLRRANFWGAFLDNVDLTEADLLGADLSGGVRIINSTLKDANLDKVNFDLVLDTSQVGCLANTNFENVQLDNVTVSKKDFIEQLTSLDITGKKHILQNYYVDTVPHYYTEYKIASYFFIRKIVEKK